jgi:2,3-bisphosphoglycerate-dependent phosphoglycerate mutase
MAENDPRNPAFDPKYKDLTKEQIPLTESLKDTVNRIVPYWKDEISVKLAGHKEVLVAAHGNSLRGIIKYLKNMGEEEIIKLNLPTGIPYVFEFDDSMTLISDYFLGDPEKIKAAMDKVANQGKAK